MFTLAKIDARAMQIFGFANVAVTDDGTPVVDLQGDEIPPQVLEQAAYNFVQNFAECGEMHRDDCTKGTLIESFMVTPDKLEAMGLAKDAISPRWWVGFQLDAPTFAKVVSGEYAMLSIQGTADWDEVDA